jgi:uncharacterized protein YnzC (UPF0291/DUF896 family)
MEESFAMAIAAVVQSEVAFARREYVEKLRAIFRERPSAANGEDDPEVAALREEWVKRITDEVMDTLTAVKEIPND